MVIRATGSGNPSAPPDLHLGAIPCRYLTFLARGVMLRERWQACSWYELVTHWRETRFLETSVFIAKLYSPLKASLETGKVPAALYRFLIEWKIARLCRRRAHSSSIQKLFSLYKSYLVARAIVAIAADAFAVASSFLTYSNFKII